MIKTNNLQLITVERIHKEAFLRNKSELAAILNVTIPESWPQFPEAFSLSANETHQLNPPSTNWRGYFFIDPTEKLLVGNGGFKGRRC